MKVYSLAVLATGAAAKGFNNIAIGGSQSWGHLSWQSESGVLLVTVDNSDAKNCAAIDTSFSVNVGPYAVNDWEVVDGPKEICANLDIEGVTVGGDLNAFYASGDSCLSATKVSAEAAALLDDEFNSVSFANNGDKVCATLTKNRLSTAEDNGVTFFRSFDKQYYAWHQPNVGDIDFAAYASGNCGKALIGQWQWNQPSNENWYSFCSKQKVTNKKVRSVKINGNCHNLRNQNWEKAAKKVYMETDKESFNLWMSQDNPFVPTHYYFDYNRVETEYNDEVGYPGKYHIHVGKVDENDDSLRCGPAATGGHFNPYGLTAPFAENSQTNYDYESGDLSLRFGTLVGVDETNVDIMDWNIPLHGSNAVNDMSIVFHNAADASRFVCWNLAEVNVGRNGHRGH